MATTYLKLTTLEDQGAGAIAAVGIKKLSVPNWAPQSIGLIGHDCRSLRELQEMIVLIRKDLDRIEKDGQLFFERERKRRAEGRIKWQNLK